MMQEQPPAKQAETRTEQVYLVPLSKLESGRRNPTVVTLRNRSRAGR